MKNEKINTVLTQVKKLAEIKKKLRDEITAVFPIATKELFTQYPELKSFSWTQYTPYFNDGDICEFSVHSDYFTVNGFDAYSDDEDDAENGMNIHRRAKTSIWDGERKDNPEFSQYFAEIIETIKELLNSFDEEDLKFIFGDHKEITVTEEGAVAKDYEHD